ncbi:MAG TPA: alkylmercury lyase family protein [Gaiellaceae bacterium]|nr:alkylmercury lyase family protein [Gaiellaceae bacterium]
MTRPAQDTTPAEVLAAAGIAPERVGAARTARLRDRERAVYHWILRSFAAGPPERRALAGACDRHGVSLRGLLEVLAREDLVHADESDGIVVAYPFSGRPTPHRLLLDGREVFAMCAIDALGMAPMLDRPVEVVSSDPVDGQEIRVSLTPDGSASWEPEQAVVVTGRSCDRDAFRSCQVLNFFASPGNAEQYLRRHTDVSGFQISIPQAIESGRLIFGRVLAASH